MTNLKYKTIRDWLEQKGFLIVETDEDGKNKWIPSDAGEEIGITFETRSTSYGKPYKVTLYDISAQHFIIDNFQSILNDLPDDESVDVQEDCQ